LTLENYNIIVLLKGLEAVKCRFPAFV